MSVLSVTITLNLWYVGPATLVHSSHSAAQRPSFASAPPHRHSRAILLDVSDARVCCATSLGALPPPGTDGPGNVFLVCLVGAQCLRDVVCVFSTSVSTRAFCTRRSPQQQTQVTRICRAFEAGNLKLSMQALAEAFCVPLTVSTPCPRNASKRRVALHLRFRTLFDIVPYCTCPALPYIRREKYHNIVSAQ